MSSGTWRLRSSCSSVRLSKKRTLWFGLYWRFCTKPPLERHHGTERDVNYAEEESDIAFGCAFDSEFLSLHFRNHRDLRNSRKRTRIGAPFVWTELGNDFFHRIATNESGADGEGAQSMAKNLEVSYLCLRSKRKTLSISWLTRSTRRLWAPRPIHPEF